MKHSHSCHSMPSVQQQTDIKSPDPGLEPGTNNQSAEINSSEKSEKSEKSSPSPINISEKSLNEIQTPSPPSSENTGKSGSGWAKSGFGSESGVNPERRDSETKIVVASTCSLNNDQEALSKQLELAKLQSRDLCIENKNLQFNICM